MIVKRFENIVDRVESKVAVKTGAGAMTYRQLDDKANQVAHEIRKISNTSNQSDHKGGTGVALLFEHGADMIAGLMGALKAQALYVPMDRNYPEQRLAYMLNHSEASVIVTNRENMELASRLAEQADTNPAVVNISDMDTSVPRKRPANNESGDRLAYILYTSGSTGKPKGVLQNHRNIIYFIDNMVERFKITEGDRMTLFSSLGHDAAVMDIFGSLLNGATLCPYDVTKGLADYDLIRWLSEEEITIWHSVPTVYRYFVDLMRGHEEFPELRHILLGGEEVRESDVRIFKRFFKSNTSLVNMYGMSESSLNSFWIVNHGDSTNGVSLGDPLERTKLMVISEEGDILEEIGVGEIVVASDHVALGYWRDGQPESEAFSDDEELGKLYWTGDLGRFTAEGDIQFIGRKDMQVKIRGFRVELAEIETLLLEHPVVKEAVVALKQSDQKEPVLCAYYVAAEDSDNNDLKGHVSQFLPDYMVPAAFVKLDKMPLTATNKVDRQALPDPVLTKREEREDAELADEVEVKLAGIWADVLNIDKSVLDAFTSFFEVGGHSLNATVLVGKIAKVFNVKVELSEILEHPALREMANTIKASTAGEESYPRLEPDPDNMHEPFPLTDVQMAYLMGRDSRYELGGISTHVYIEIPTTLDIPRLNMALNKLIERHPMMRTIIMEDGRQKILEEIPRYKIHIEDVSGKTQEEQDDMIAVERKRMSHYVFPTDQWPLFEIRAFKTSESISYLCIGFDLLIADNFSSAILNQELEAYYNDLELELEPIDFTFRDYMMGMNILKESDAYKKDKEYWLSLLPDFPPSPAIPLKCQPSEVKEPRFKRFSHVFTQEETAILKDKARQWNVTMSALMAAIYADVLGFWSNQPRLALNLTVFNRYPFHKDVHKIVGDFTSLIILAIDNSKGDTFWQQAKQVQKTLFDSLEHRLFDGVEFIREIARYRDMRNKAVMPVVFTSTLFNADDEHDTGDRQVQILGDGHKNAGMSISQTSQVYIDSGASEVNGRLVVAWTYVDELFEPEVIEGMFGHYRDMIAAVSEGAEESFTYSLLASDRSIMEDYNATETEFRRTTMHRLFEEQVRKSPDNEAVIDGDLAMTYQELDLHSNRLAHHLKEQGIGPNCLVGVVAPRTMDMVVKVMGVLKAGASFIPINPEFPEKRKQFILDNSGAKLCLDDSLDSIEDLHDLPGDPLEVNVDPDDLAYVIYTSGSTGNPKGVMITHQQAVNTIFHINGEFNVDGNDRVMGISSMCFDLSIYDVFGTLAAGAALVLVKDQRDVENLVETVDTHGITIWNSVPAIMDMAVSVLEMETPPPRLDSLRLVLLSGDWIPLYLPAKIMDFFPNANVISLGGATEGSIWSIYYPIREFNDQWRSVPYGRPMANQTFYVLNYRKQWCHPGVLGELYIGGDGVAIGYINDNEKTAAQFIQHPEFGKIYRTGDYGIFHREGHIEFMGRKDFQVKIRGYRVELGEIESCLLEYPDVTKTVVIDRLDASNKKYLIAYIVVDQEVPHQDLRKHLGEKLPEYMIPSYFVTIDEIPLTANGKIDRKALPEPDYDAIIESDHVAPRDDVERALVEIWQELLKLPKVGITDDFFESGGDSLKAATLVSKIHERLEVRIRLTEVFRSSTIEALAGAIRSFTNHEHYIPIPQAEALDYYAATSPQRGFYVMQQVDPDNLSYHMPTIAFELYGELDREKIEKAFVDLISRQESLRTSIELVNDTPVQVVHGEVSFSIESFEVESQNPEEEQKKAREIIKEFVRPFDLSVAPLFRAALIKFEEDRHLLVIDIHHIITDGSSMILFMAQFLMFYRGETLPPLRIQHKDFSQWQASEAGRKEMEKQERFWLEEYSGDIKNFDLPTDFQRPKVQTFDGSLVVFDLEEEQVKALKQLALDEEATLFMALLSIFTIFLSKISQQEEVLVSMPVANRRHSDLQQVVGMFVNTLVVRNFPEKDKTFTQYLQDTRKKTLASFDNQSYPLEELVSNLNLKRDASRSPLTDTMFVMHNVDIPMVEMPGITIKRYFAPQEHTQRDLTLAVASRANQLNISFQYNINLFKHETIEKYSGYFREILGIVLENRDIRIAEIHVDHDMLSAKSDVEDIDLGFADEMN